METRVKTIRSRLHDSADDSSPFAQVILRMNNTHNKHSQWLSAKSVEESYDSLGEIVRIRGLMTVLEQIANPQSKYCTCPKHRVGSKCALWVLKAFIYFNGENAIYQTVAKPGPSRGKSVEELRAWALRLAALVSSLTNYKFQCRGALGDVWKTDFCPDPDPETDRGKVGIFHSNSHSHSGNHYSYETLLIHITAVRLSKTVSSHVMQVLFEVLVDRLVHSGDDPDDWDVFGQLIINPWVFPEISKCAVHCPLDTRQEVVKDICMLLYINKENRTMIMNQPDWHMWITPFLTSGAIEWGGTLSPRQDAHSRGFFESPETIQKSLSDCMGIQESVDMMKAYTAHVATGRESVHDGDFRNAARASMAASDKVLNDSNAFLQFKLEISVVSLMLVHTTQYAETVEEYGAMIQQILTRIDVLEDDRTNVTRLVYFGVLNRLQNDKSLQLSDEIANVPFYRNLAFLVNHVLDFVLFGEQRLPSGNISPQNVRFHSENGVVLDILLTVEMIKYLQLKLRRFLSENSMKTTDFNTKSRQLLATLTDLYHIFLRIHMLFECIEQNTHEKDPGLFQRVTEDLAGSLARRLVLLSSGFTLFKRKKWKNLLIAYFAEFNEKIWAERTAEHMGVGEALLSPTPEWLTERKAPIQRYAEKLVFDIFSRPNIAQLIRKKWVLPGGTLQRTEIEEKVLMNDKTEPSGLRRSISDDLHGGGGQEKIRSRGRSSSAPSLSEDVEDVKDLMSNTIRVLKG